MTNQNINSHSDFSSSSSPSPLPPTPDHHSQKLRRKRSKLIKFIEPSRWGVFDSSSDIVVSNPKICHPEIATNCCRLCGKKFSSSKALHGHMRCHPVPERGWRGVSPPSNFRRTTSSAFSAIQHQSTVTSAEDHEIASCLLLLSNSTNCGGGDNGDGHGAAVTAASYFECSSCKKVFGSHQALGGHRASHKNVKGCFAINTSCQMFDFVSSDAKEKTSDQLDLNLPVDDESSFTLDLRLGL